MIRAHMATYPPRIGLLEQSLPTIAGQVDQVFLCLNEFAEVPGFLAAYPNVTPILPERDLKDVGKFLTAPAPEDLVVLVDDDLHYHPDHVRHLRQCGDRIGLDRNVVGLHGSIYRGTPENGSLSRKAIRFDRALDRSRRVHHLGTGTVLALGRNVAPLDQMDGSQKFVDVRYGRWLLRQGIGSWAVERPEGFLREVSAGGGKRETIFRTFTKRAPEILQAEIRALVQELSARPGAEGPAPEDVTETAGEAE